MPAPPPSLRNLALADITSEDVRWMIREGETLVELKSEIPKGGMGPTIASFANTLGGWVILGIADDTREVVGWKPKGRADDVDYLREVLRREVDPMPPFAAKPMEVTGKRVSVIRVYESADTPHIVRGSGSVFVREPGGKRPIQEHAHLIELARRGEDAERSALARMAELPIVGRVLGAPDSGYSNNEMRDVRWIARAAPLTVSPVTRDWPLTRRAADWCLNYVDGMVGQHTIWDRKGPQLETYGRAIATRVTQQRGKELGDRAVLVADSGGVVGAELTVGTHGGDEPLILLSAMLEEAIKPLALALAAMLFEAEANGRAIVDLWCLLPPKGTVHGQQRPSVPRQLHSSRQLPIPATDSEVEELALSWHRELQRSIGVAKFEDDVV